MQNFDSAPLDALTLKRNALECERNALECELEKLRDQDEQAEVLVNLGIIGPNDKIPAGFFDRVREIALTTNASLPETAINLAGIETLFSLDDGISLEKKITDAKPLLTEVVQDLAGSEIPHIDDEIAGLIIDYAVKHMGQDGIISSIVNAIAERKKSLARVEVKEHDVLIDTQSGTVMGSENSGEIR